MKTIALSPPAAVVLAGGQSSRLGVPSKALVDLAGKPMIQHVIGRLSPQADPIMLSVQQSDESLAALGREMVVDVVQRHRGPLTGLCSALLRLECRGVKDWLLLSPCDAPFLPSDLAARLGTAAQEQSQRVAVACYDGAKQPVFSLWHLDSLPSVKEAVLDRGQGGLMRLLDHLPHAVVDWPVQSPNPFFNVNTPADMAEAERQVDDNCRKD